LRAAEENGAEESGFLTTNEAVMPLEKRILQYRAAGRASSIDVPEWLLIVLVIAPSLLLAMLVPDAPAMTG
jgi:hypothetical protein